MTLVNTGECSLLGGCDSALFYYYARKVIPLSYPLTRPFICAPYISGYREGTARQAKTRADTRVLAHTPRKEQCLCRTLL